MFKKFLMKIKYFQFQKLKSILPPAKKQRKILKKKHHYKLYNQTNFKFHKQLHKQLSEAYRNRKWEEFDKILNSISKKSIIYNYWETMKLSYFNVLNKPSKKWKKIHKLCRKNFHFLAQYAFRNYIYSLIFSMRLTRLKRELPKFEKLYNTHCPLIYLPYICALYIKSKEYRECLLFLDKLKQSLTKESLIHEFELKSFPYYWICYYNTGKNENITKKSISEGLKDKMKTYFKVGSTAESILNDCLNCWQAIKNTNAVTLVDLRYIPEQALILKNKIEKALINKEPFLMLRLGDGESFAFAESLNDFKEKIVHFLEDFWWGTKLNDENRKRIIEDFHSTLKSADVIGLPYMIRLSKTLNQFSSNNLSSYSDISLKVLFNGIENFVKKNNMQCSLWVDEYSNYALIKKKDIKKFIELSTNVILVTCFKIPKNNIFNHLKVDIINIPPQKKISLVENVVVFNDKSKYKTLPEIINGLKNNIESKVTKGTLLLMSGGFAGKSILKYAKNKGAVAIDFGSSIDNLMGYKTRNLELHILFDD